MRIVFAGTPHVALPGLAALTGTQDVAAVITRPDAPVGRKRLLTPSPVAEAAEHQDIPVIKAARLDQTVTEQVRVLRPDLGVIIAYGGLVREPLLSLPRHGWINLHFSLLPRWRGAAPVQHTIIAGEKIAGASVFQLVPELDAGAEYARLETPIGADETAGELLDRLAVLGADVLTKTVSTIAAGEARAVPQTGEPTFAPKLTAEDGRIDWDCTAVEVYARIRGVTPEPGAFTFIKGNRVKILRAGPAEEVAAPAPGEIQLRSGRVVAGTGGGAIELLLVQPAGKTAMAAADWWRGLGMESVVVERE